MNNSTLTVMGKVLYKQVVTEQYKAKARAEFDDQLAKIDGELADFDKQMSKTRSTASTVQC